MEIKTLNKNIFKNILTLGEMEGVFNTPKTQSATKLNTSIECGPLGK